MSSLPKLNIKPSMVFDAICYLDRRTDPTSYDIPHTGNFFKKMDALCGGKLCDSYLGMSTFCYVVATFAEGSAFDVMSLDNLADFFREHDQRYFCDLVRQKVTNEFLASFIYPMLDDALTYGLFDIFVNQLKILKTVNFEQLWRADLLPLIQNVIQSREAMYGKVTMKNAFEDIQKLKQAPFQSDINIYIAALSGHVAFSLPNNSFLEPCVDGSGVWLLFHELMHGFASDNAISCYLKYIKSNQFLTEQHAKLIKFSGNEEEFVAAAEYYLRMKHNGESKDDLLKHARTWCGGVLPTSVLLFELLSREAETPDGYNRWLIDIFTNNRLPEFELDSNIKEYLDKITS
ncbi:MAG: hypothetical protein FWC95_03730 [Defluviitaleaceae bacterium]|nr:hypothetical protein [Defluviitaleaceae bacterium]